MSTFEYLSVLLSIIVGLGITHIILGLGRLIGHASGRSIYWVHLLWALNIALYLVVFWWWAINLRELEEWAFVPFLVVLLEPALLCLAGAILFPVNMPPDLEYKTHFYRSRKAFFSVVVALGISDLSVVLYASPAAHFSELGFPYQLFLSATLFGGIIAAFSDSERVQGAMAVYYCGALFIFVMLTQSSIPA